MLIFFSLFDRNAGDYSRPTLERIFLGTNFNETFTTILQP